MSAGVNGAQPRILSLVHAFAAAREGAAGGGDPEQQARVERARRVLARPPAERMFTGPVVDTDMVDTDVAGAPSTNGDGAEGPLAARIRAAAMSLEALRRDPGIAGEFDRSLRKRARLWEPLLAAVLDELGVPADDAVVRLVAAWFTLVHLSGPVDHWIDGDEQGEHWERRSAAQGLEIVFAIKDEALSAPLQASGADARAVDLARGAVELASAAVTSTMAAFFDVRGAVEYGPGANDAALAALHERLVHWKSAWIYRTLTRALSLAGDADEARRAALERFGYIVGYCIQAFDDAGGIWGDGGDLDKERIALTFPLVYGINAPLPERDAFRRELAADAAARDRARIIALADRMNALAFLEFLIEEGAHECEGVLAPLRPETRGALLAWFRAYFRHQI